MPDILGILLNYSVTMRLYMSLILCHSLSLCSVSHLILQSKTLSCFNVEIGKEENRTFIRTFMKPVYISWENIAQLKRSTDLQLKDNALMFD